MPNLARSKELREKRANLVELNKQVLAQIKDDTPEARAKELEAQWDARDAEITALTGQIERAEKQERNELELARPLAERRSGRLHPQPETAEQIAENKTRYKKAYWDGLRWGMQALEPEDQQLLRQGFRPFNGQVMDLSGPEGRAMSLTVAAGGYTVPEGFGPDLQKNMLAFGGVRQLARIFPTSAGNSIPWPTVDDTSNEASIVGEGSALTSPQDPTFGVVTLGSYMYRTLCLASLELLQDSAFNLEAYIRDWIAERFARGTNRHYTTGNGSTQPHGFIPASSSGVTAASATSVGFNDLVDLEHSVDPAYRSNPSVAWQMADGTLKIIKKLVDSQNRPLWLPGIAVREPDTILGYKYAINQHMAAVAASNKSLAFGDWSKFIIRDVMSMLIVRANELHIGNGQIGFYAFFRTDSKMLDAGTDPVKHLTHPSPN
jgi:HK97 family phage major capsid protein